eukprot:scaffold25409_cov23-Tisochrysis_lutea.AAC.4
MTHIIPVARMNSRGTTKASAAAGSCSAESAPRSSARSCSRACTCMHTCASTARSDFLSTALSRSPSTSAAWLSVSRASLIVQAVPMASSAAARAAAASDGRARRSTPRCAGDKGGALTRSITLPPPPLLLLLFSTAAAAPAALVLLFLVWVGVSDMAPASCSTCAHLHRASTASAPVEAVDVGWGMKGCGVGMAPPRVPHVPICTASAAVEAVSGVNMKRCGLGSVRCEDAKMWGVGVVMCGQRCKEAGSVRVVGSLLSPALSADQTIRSNDTTVYHTALKSTKATALARYATTVSTEQKMTKGLQAQQANTEGQAS